MHGGRERAGCGQTVRVPGEQGVTTVSGAPMLRRVGEASPLAARFDDMLAQGLQAVSDPFDRNELAAVAAEVSSASWKRWHAWRTPEDSRQEHEWVVFANAMRITQAEGLTLSDKRVATAFTFCHDSFHISRTTEAMIRAVEEAAEIAERHDAARGGELRRRAAQMRQDKQQQRMRHMEGGGRNAELLLHQLAHPESRDRPLLEAEEIRRCVDIIKGHDLWETGAPHPPGSDRLAVACLEADALWPIPPLGVLADLERPVDEGRAGDFIDPGDWTMQVAHSLRTLHRVSRQLGERPAGAVC